MPLCPRCEAVEIPLHIPGQYVLSRRNNEPICPSCGQEEAMVDLQRIRLTDSIKEREDRMAGRPKVKDDPARPTKKVMKSRKAKSKKAPKKKEEKKK